MRRRAAARIKQQSRSGCIKTGGVYLGFYPSGGRKFPHGNFRTTRVLRSQNTACRRNASFATAHLLPSGGRTARQHSGAHPSYPCPRPGAVGRRIWLSPAAGQESRDSFSDALTDGRGQRKENLAAFALLGTGKHKGGSFGRPSRPSERRNIYFLRRLRVFRRSRSCGHSRICPARRQALSQNPCALIIGHVIGQIVRFCILSSCPRPGL